MSEIRCPKCNYEGVPRSRIQHWFVIVGLLFFGYNLYLQILQVSSKTQPSDTLMTGIVLSLAVIVGLIIYGLKEYCPKCGNKQIVRK
ncbi:MAG: hypothetical protein WC529_08800 [Candidatus Margulisiibacteriota bacterium]